MRNDDMVYICNLVYDHRRRPTNGQIPVRTYLRTDLFRVHTRRPNFNQLTLIVDSLLHTSRLKNKYNLVSGGRGREGGIRFDSSIVSVERLVGTASE